MPAHTKARTRTKPEFSRPLTREKIAAAAIEIVRHEGQSALSMRKVAGLFGVDVAALYRHVRNKEELLAEVGRLASEIIDLEAPTEGTWEARFLDLTAQIRTRIAQHPELGIYGEGSPWATPFFARANGLIAELLCEAGLTGQELVLATQTVLHLVTSIAQSEVLTRDTPRAQNRAFAETIRAQLPDGVEKAWPQTRARDAWSIDFDALFSFAMRKALDSIVPEATRPR
jgi:AcrR family transcriptional regulator